MTRSDPFRGPAMRAAAVLVAWLAAACAPVPLPPSEDAAAFPRDAASEIFSAGYGSISERYIEPVTPAALALEGMRGLSAIDPELTVGRSGDTIVVSSGDRLVARRPAPGDDDVEGWAALTSEVSAMGRRNSDELREISEEKLYEAVFDGMLSNLDIYSRYAGAEEARDNRAKREGFGGIGIRFRITGERVLVSHIMPNNPAAKAGLKRGDVITHVGAVPLAGLAKGEVTALLRGKVHSKVELTVERKGSDRLLRFEIERKHIVPTTVTYGHENGIVFLKVTSFNQRTSRSIAEKMKKARKTLGDELKGLVIDLRGNPGGLLKQSVKVANLFLTQGNILSTRGRHPDSVQHYEADGRDIAEGLPVVVLVDGKSASAAEIVASALQDRGRAVVIGTASFGKGTVQTVIHLPNDGEVTLTWSRLMTPSGYLLHGLGVFPDLCTSGVSGNVHGVAAELIAERAKFAPTRSAWRKTGAGGEDRRRELRASCPAQRRRLPVEAEIARQVIADREIYRRALYESPATAEAVE